MSIGEFDSPSKPATQAYRDGWEYLYSRPGWTELGEAYIRAANTPPRVVTYENGCPILPHE